MNSPRDTPHLAEIDDVTQDQRHIGVAHPRQGAHRLAQGRGQFVDDIELPRLAHVVYWRSPVAHARIGRIDATVARAMAGVVGVFTGHDVARLCKPWVARNHNLFIKADFVINMRHRTVECPAGEIEYFQPGSVVEFDPDACGRCPQRARCTMAPDAIRWRSA